MLQLPIGDVSSGDLEELSGFPIQEVGHDKVGVLAHDDPFLFVSQIRDGTIVGSIAIRQIQSMP
jgi:hypothetical protein